MGKPKPVNVRLVAETDEKGGRKAVYQTMDRIVTTYHPDMAAHECRIAIAGHSGWTEDADGRLKLGQCKRATDLDRDLHHFDFVILVNTQAWERLSEEQREAVLDHELCHIALARDSDGEVKKDERGRVCWRLRKHDVEEFTAIIERRGLYKPDLERFAAAVVGQSSHPLFADQEGGPEPPKVTAEGGEVWRSLPIDELLKLVNRPQAAKALRENCEQLGLATIGRFSDWMAMQGDYWHRNLEGIGDSAADSIDNAWSQFWSVHAEATQAR